MRHTFVANRLLKQIISIFCLGLTEAEKRLSVDKYEILSNHATVTALLSGMESQLNVLFIIRTMLKKTLMSLQFQVFLHSGRKILRPKSKLNNMRQISKNLKNDAQSYNII